MKYVTMNISEEHSAGTSRCYQRRDPFPDFDGDLYADPQKSVKTGCFRCCAEIFACLNQADWPVQYPGRKNAKNGGVNEDGETDERR